MIFLLLLIFFVVVTRSETPDILLGRCSPDSCKNGANCHQVEKFRYLCECDPGHYGFQCEHTRTVECLREKNCPPSKDVCGRDHPCLNGFCKNTDKGFHCWCPVGYSGKHCEVEDPHLHCRPEMCDHGHCTIEKHEPKCVCDEGWTGDRCDEEMELSYECVDSPCAPLSLCLNTSGSIECVCAMGKTGPRCEFDLHLCTGDQECRNGGYCVHNTCVCREGFEGTSCELTVLDPCAIYDNCIGYQVCVANRSEILGFSCVCPPGYEGLLCDTPIANSIDSKTDKVDLTKCYLRKCAELAGNGVCDQECNHYTCGFDGGDCPPSRNCVFDEVEGSGEAPEDKLNCTMTEVRLPVLVKPGTFVRKVDDFLSSVSQRLRAWVRIRKTEGELDVFELNAKGKQGPRVSFGSRTDARMEYRVKRETRRRDRDGVAVFLQIGLSECAKKCHRHLNFAAHTLSDREWREERWREFGSTSVSSNDINKLMKEVVDDKLLLSTRKTEIRSITLLQKKIQKKKKGPRDNFEEISFIFGDKIARGRCLMWKYAIQSILAKHSIRKPVKLTTGYDRAIVLFLSSAEEKQIFENIEHLLKNNVFGISKLTLTEISFVNNDLWFDLMEDVGLDHVHYTVDRLSKKSARSIVRLAACTKSMRVDLWSTNKRLQLVPVLRDVFSAKCDDLDLYMNLVEPTISLAAAGELITHLHTLEKRIFFMTYSEEEEEIKEYIGMYKLDISIDNRGHSCLRIRTL